MSTYVFQRGDQYLTGFDTAGVPQTTADLNEALWIGVEDDDWDGYAIPASEAGFTAVDIAKMDEYAR